MENSLLEILTYYVIGGALLIGAPGIFFLIVFMPALQNTKGRMVGYKDHKTYGDSSIYENTRSNNEQFYLTLNSWTKKQNALMDGQQWSVWSLLWDLMQPQVKSSQVCGERHVTHSSFHGRRVYICRPIDRWKCWWWWQRAGWWTDATCVCT